MTIYFEISAEIIAKEVFNGNNYYFKLLNDFNLLPSIFSGLIVNYYEIEIQYIEVRLACLLQNNINIKEKLKMLKYGKKLSETVAFLIELLDFDLNKLNYYLVKKSEMNLEILEKWVMIMKLGTYHQRFLHFKSEKK